MPETNEWMYEWMWVTLSNVQNRYLCPLPPVNATVHKWFVIAAGESGRHSDAVWHLEWKSAWRSQQGEWATYRQWKYVVIPFIMFFFNFWRSVDHHHPEELHNVLYYRGNVDFMIDQYILHYLLWKFYMSPIMKILCRCELVHVSFSFSLV